MNEFSELAYIHLVNQLKEENRMLRDEVIALRKLLVNQRYRQDGK